MIDSFNAASVVCRPCYRARVRLIHRLIFALMSWWWSVVFFAVFLIGVTKSGFGSGVGLMIIPMMALAMKHIPGYDSSAALGLLLPLLILGDLIAVYQYRHL